MTDQLATTAATNGHANGHEDAVGAVLPGIARFVAATGGRSGGDLHQIKPKGQDPGRVVHEALHGLVRANEPPTVFVRGGRLARVVCDERGRAHVEAMSDDATRTAVMHACRFVRTVSVKGADGKREPIDEPMEVPRYVPASLRTLGEWPGLPALTGLVEAPVLRPDGSIVQHDGYDAATGLYLRKAPGLELADIHDDADQAARAAAVALLRDELLGDFPFVAASDLANALALLLTPIIRHLVPVVPMALLTGTIRGSGKGLLADVAAIITTGARAEVYVYGDGDDVELRKAITSMLDRGAGFVMLDEVRQLRSGVLAGALTSETWSQRRLGQTEMVSVPQRATWVATGNNVEIGGDLDRRIFPIRLDPKTARPWTRQGFRHADLPGWTSEHRGELLHALLTLASAWWSAGRPPAADEPTFGGFQPWASTIAGILHYAGVPGFLGNLVELWDEGNEEAGQWETFLSGVLAHYGPKTFTVAELAEDVNKRQLRELLPDELEARHGDRGFKVVLGIALRHRVNTRHGQRQIYLAAAGQNRSKAKVYRVVEGAA